jgi:nucleoside-diphosphate-sugar epimerase
MKILVTAGSGLVGTWLRKVSILDKKNQYYFHSREHGDLTEFSNVEKMISNCNPDIIIHNAASLNGALDSDSNKVLNAKFNIQIFSNILNMISNNQRIVCISSYHVFNIEAPFENFNLLNTNQSSVYSRLKTEEMFLAKEYPNVKFILYPHLFGIYDNYQDQRAHFIANSIKRIYHAKQIGLKNIDFFGSPRQILQFATGEQAANFVVTIANNFEQQYYKYICADIGWATKVLTVFEGICRILEYDGTIELPAKEITSKNMYFRHRDLKLDILDPDFISSLKTTINGFING